MRFDESASAFSVGYLGEIGRACAEEGDERAGMAFYAEMRKQLEARLPKRFVGPAHRANAVCSPDDPDGRPPVMEVEVGQFDGGGVFLTKRPIGHMDGRHMDGLAVRSDLHMLCSIC